MRTTRRKLLVVVAAAVFVLAQQVGAQQPDTPKSVAEPASCLADVSKLLMQRWPRNRTINIVCHGHSVPAGYFKTPIVDTFSAC